MKVLKVDNVLYKIFDNVFVMNLQTAPNKSMISHNYFVFILMCVSNDQSCCDNEGAYLGYDFYY